MDKTTFGDSQAAIKLVEILEKFDDKKINVKVSRLLERASSGFLQLQKLDGFKLFFSKYLRDELLKNTECFPDEIQRFVKNVITAKYRRFLCKIKSK